MFLMSMLHNEQEYKNPLSLFNKKKKNNNKNTHTVKIIYTSFFLLLTQCRQSKNKGN